MTWYIWGYRSTCKNVDPKEIDQEFIVNLKLEVDEMFDQGDDVFKNRNYKYNYKKLYINKW
jgi:hypothetical protein